jgi:hypothetical protein
VHYHARAFTPRFFSRKKRGVFVRCVLRACINLRRERDAFDAFQLVAGEAIHPKSKAPLRVCLTSALVIV